MPIRTVAVKTTPTRLLARNPDRVVYSVVNDSTVDIFISYDKNVATSGAYKGVKIMANGGSCEDEHHKGEVWAISTSETEVTVVEVSKGE